METEGFSHFLQSEGNMAEDRGERLIRQVSELQHQLKVPPLQVSHVKIKAPVRKKWDPGMRIFG